LIAFRRPLGTVKVESRPGTSDVLDGPEPMIIAFLTLVEPAAFKINALLQCFHLSRQAHVLHDSRKDLQGEEEISDTKLDFTAYLITGTVVHLKFEAGRIQCRTSCIMPITAEQVRT
jgi:hypothetical protein